VSLVGDAKISLPDSLLTITKAYTYNITSPDTAQAILDAVRERKLEPEWRINFAEGDLNLNMRRYQKALAFYERVGKEPVLRDSTHLQLLLLKYQMDCYDALIDADKLTHAIIRLRNLSQSCGDKAFETMTFFTSGKWHHYNGQKEKGYDYCQKAVEMMKATDYVNKHIELRAFYAELLRMYARDRRFDDALRMSKLQEQEALQPSPVIMLKARERALRQVYALRASVLAMAGRMAEADKAYSAWKKTSVANPVNDMDIYDYLRLSRHKEEALGTITRYREFIQAQGDTISYRMLSVLNKEALLYMDMGEYEKAEASGMSVNRIAHSLHTKRLGEHMQTTYELLDEQNNSNKKTLWLSLLSVVVVMLFIISLIILYYVRKVRHRNLILLKVLNGLDAYRRAVINGETPTSPEAVAAIETIRSLQLPEDLPQGKENDPDDEDRQLYVEMDKKVTSERLFLKPGLGREDLMRLIGVDKNRFGKMISKYSDASNTSVYINIKRAEYGAQLLLEHPEYTIATVASECGMSNTVTFNRTFKEIYNMTPSEYREKMNDILQAGK
jgi:Transcriptional regulator containing an amidase domain and an AraC-type DNA-binding HTH domain